MPILHFLILVAARAQMLVFSAARQTKRPSCATVMNSLARGELGCAGEFIKDTEEYINIDLDSSRNRLIRLEIVLTAGTFAVAIWGLVGSKSLHAS